MATFHSEPRGPQNLSDTDGDTVMWLLGDYILAVSMTLNGSMALAYLYQGQWSKAGYWFACLQLNYWLIRM